MKIVVVGLGGVGGITGGRLAAGLSDDPNHEVVFWCRGKVLDAILEKGLQILNNGGKTTVRPTLATCNVADVEGADLLIFATKGYHLDLAARELVPSVTPKTAVIPLLNGVSAASVLEECLPKADVLEGCIYVSAHVERPGTVRQVGTVHRIFFGKKGISEADNRIRYGNIEQVFKKAGLNAALTERIDVEVWSKFIFLSPFAGVTTLFRRSIDEALHEDESFETVKKMIREIEGLARAKNVGLPDNIADITIEKARSFAPSTKTSMQLDQEQGRPTELESLIGYVCREGKNLGVSTPVYENIYGNLKAICK